MGGVKTPFVRYDLTGIKRESDCLLSNAPACQESSRTRGWGKRVRSIECATFQIGIGAAKEKAER